MKTKLVAAVQRFAAIFASLLALQITASGASTLTDLWRAAVAALPLALEKFVLTD